MEQQQQLQNLSLGRFFLYCDNVGCYWIYHIATFAPGLQYRTTKQEPLLFNVIGRTQIITMPLQVTASDAAGQWFAVSNTGKCSQTLNRRRMASTNSNIVVWRPMEPQQPTTNLSWALLSCANVGVTGYTHILPKRLPV